MGNDDHGDPQLFVDTSDQIQNRVGGGWVEGAGGFVAEEHLRVGCKGSGNRNPLLLSTGELGGVGFRFVPQSNDVKQF